MGNALDLLQHEEPLELIMKSDGRRRQAIWHAHNRYFRFRDEPPGTVDPSEVDEWWPIAFKHR